MDRGIVWPIVALLVMLGIIAAVFKFSGDDGVVVNNNQTENNDAEAVEGQKTYTSDKLGVTFKYLEDQNPDEAVALLKVTELGSKIYLSTGDENPQNGQSIEKIDKNPAHTLEQAISDKLLQGYSPTICFPTSKTVAQVNSESTTGEVSPYPPTYVLGEMDFKSTPNPNDPNQPWWQGNERCPQNYVRTNGLRYFLYDPAYPDRFYFLNIGQYAILSSEGQDWASTVRITDIK